MFLWGKVGLYTPYKCIKVNGIIFQAATEDCSRHKEK